ncbi:hypothetical protein IU485_28360 [Nocardia cyriacigeorgica]|uniref:hypothetical protein n=1 Tax=Nocardia cyriacigeorgica TaxID=135487 RepID=UPI00189506F8|nr:hypothetical protein [Nocardia cyriacigeorgica]MBF6085287.1 hypothetical protein [Nocardia cyriacigeorgica]
MATDALSWPVELRLIGSHDDVRAVLRILEAAGLAVETDGRVYRTAASVRIYARARPE